MINVSCSRTQRSDACEARTRGPSVSCSLNKPGYEENYPCADPEGAGAPGPAKSQSYIFSPQLILQRGGGNGFIAEKTILSQGSRGGPTFSGEVHPRGDPNANCYHNNL